MKCNSVNPDLGFTLYPQASLAVNLGKYSVRLRMEMMLVQPTKSHPDMTVKLLA